MCYQTPHPLKGSLSNDDVDANENSKTAMGLLRKTTTLHVHHSFLYISLPSLPNFTHCGGREHETVTTTLLFRFLNFVTLNLEFNSRKNCQNLTNLTRWNTGAPNVNFWKISVRKTI